MPSNALDFRGTNVYGRYINDRCMEAASIPDGSIAVVKPIDDDFKAGFGDPCHIQFIKDGCEVDTVLFYYPRKDGSGATLSAAYGSGVPDVDFDREELRKGYLHVCGVVVGVVEFHKPQVGR